MKKIVKHYNIQEEYTTNTKKNNNTLTSNINR